MINITAIGTGSRLRDVIRRVLDAAKGRINVAAVYDPDPLSVQSFIAEFGNGASVYDNEEKAIGHPESEWVFIGSWNCHHARQIQSAFSHGKNVFCEKPLATTIEDCLAVREAMERTHSIFAFGLVLRYSNHYRKLRELLDSGAIGKLVSFEFNETLGIDHGAYIFGNWRRDREYAGSHILEKCCHDLDLANWLTDSLPVKVASFGGKNVFAPENGFLQEEAEAHFQEMSPYVKWKSKDPRSVDPFSAGSTIMDNQVVILEYANGTRATFHTNAHSTQPERRFYLNGTKGAIRADLLMGKLELTQVNGETTVISTLPPGDMHGGGDEIMAEHLAGCMLDGRAPLASVDEGIHSAFTAFAIDRAADTNSVVDLEPIWRAAGLR